MAEILPNNTRISILSADYLIDYSLVTLLVKKPDDR